MWWWRWPRSEMLFLPLQLDGHSQLPYCLLFKRPHSCSLLAISRNCFFCVPGSVQLRSPALRLGSVFGNCDTAVPSYSPRRDHKFNWEGRRFSPRCVTHVITSLPSNCVPAARSSADWSCENGGRCLWTDGRLLIIISIIKLPFERVQLLSEIQTASGFFFFSFFIAVLMQRRKNAAWDSSSAGCRFRLISCILMWNLFKYAQSLNPHQPPLNLLYHHQRPSLSIL